jgi:hypothetical protein
MRKVLSLKFLLDEKGNLILSKDEKRLQVCQQVLVLWGNLEEVINFQQNLQSFERRENFSLSFNRGSRETMTLC